MSRRRFQMPSVRKREGKRAYWYIQYWDDVLVGKSQVRRKRHTKFLGYCPTTNDHEQRVKRGEITKREADRLRNDFMHKVNKSPDAVQPQIVFGEFARIWLDRHVSQLGAATQAKYRNQLRNHLLPAFGELRLCDIDTEVIQGWLNGKPLSWASKNDLKATLSSMFTRAEDWGYWQEKNPASRVRAGKKRYKREKRLLTDEQTDQLLADIPPKVALMIEVTQTTGCRISEVLGLQEKHVDPTGWVRIRQRWYRGDLDVVKSEHGNRDLPLGNLRERVLALLTGHAEAFLFAGADGMPLRDTSLLKYHITPAAKRLGFYFEGLGWHSFRRGAVTRLQAAGASAIEAQRFAGHAQVDMTGQYTRPERDRLEKLVERMQERGSVVEFPGKEAK